MENIETKIANALTLEYGHLNVAAYQKVLDIISDSELKTTKQVNVDLADVIDSAFKCKGCGSENIEERSGYKVCFDCGKGH